MEQNSLQVFREKIDIIDEKIIELLKQRANVVRDVKALKDGENISDFSLYIKPKREFEILEKVQNVGGVYSVCFLTNIWRMMIAASNLIEQNLEFASFDEDGRFYTSKYFGNLKPVAIDSMQNVFEKVEANDVHIFGFVSSQKEVYEYLLRYRNIRIFAGVRISAEKYVFFCGKMRNIEAHFDERAFVITTQKTDCKIVEGVYKKQCGGVVDDYNFGFFYETSSD